MARRKDTVSPEKRSEIMRAVKSRGNKATEIVFVRFLRRHHISGWQRRYLLVGNPDFCFPRERVAMFVDGCFWHGCRKHCRMPKGNHAYWNQKIASNIARDRAVVHTLRQHGWRVLRIWEHELSREKETRLCERILRVLKH